VGIKPWQLVKHFTKPPGYYISKQLRHEFRTCEFFLSDYSRVSLNTYNGRLDTSRLKLLHINEILNVKD
jgi:hypothetical protein